MPIAVSLFGLCIFALPILIGAFMLLGRTTAALGRKILVYSCLSLLVGLVFCWTGFALMLLLFWPLQYRTVRFGAAVVPLPVAIFWVSGPLGVLLGVIYARYVLT
jgi:hypothetical protein